MKVCAEYENQIEAFTAHRALLDKGAEPEDIEVRSPYPLSEHPIPAHRAKPMIGRNIVRVFWLLGIIGGFSFLTFTQWEWGLTAKTGGQPLVAVPINAIPMYECGMYAAIIMTTVMFFVETRRYRQLVPPIEEDMVVANGYIALIVGGESAKKAKDWLEGTGARSIVSYVLPLALFSLLGSGCATGNMRYQQVIKPGEQAADLPPEHSLHMPTLDEQSVKPLQPIGYLYYGDPVAYERGEADLDTKLKQLEDEKAKRKVINKTRIEGTKALKEVQPEILLYKNIPAEISKADNPVEPTEESLERGEKLFNTNCAQCHGPQGLGDGGVGERWGGPDVVPHLGDGGKYASFPDGYFYGNIIVGKNLMPAFGYKFSSHEIWDIVNYLRKLQGKA